MPTIKLLKKKTTRVATTRIKEYQSIYQDKRWWRLRNAKMRENPVCERCESLGRVTPAKEVHHRRPFDTGRDEDEIETLAFDWDNLESLCIECHKTRHNEGIFC